LKIIASFLNFIFKFKSNYNYRILTNSLQTLKNSVLG